MKQCRQDQNEWLETDGLGGFASNTVGGIRTRRYHGLLLCASTPPTGRFMLVNGFDACVSTLDGTFHISSQRYSSDAIAPEGYKLIEAFDHEPWPTWRFRLPDGTIIEQEIFVRHGQPIAALSWRAIGNKLPVKLTVRPFMSGRDYHALHHENAAFKFDPAQGDGKFTWKPYPGVPAIVAYSTGQYSHRPHWYRSFFYNEEAMRGFDATEDLAAPGVFDFELDGSNEAALILGAQVDEKIKFPGSDVRSCLAELRSRELRRRNSFASPLHRAAEQYIVQRGTDGDKTIIAGYPWFADWGRDTFISLRGLCLSTGQLEVARTILESWAKHVSQGMLPNRFPDGDGEPEYNSVDASLWYVIAVCEFLKRNPNPKPVDSLLRAVRQILDGYMAGTRHGIRMDDDGLLKCGVPGVQLTWMDSRIGDWVVTPRHGKPVEVQALWINALYLASNHFARFEPIGRRAAMSFRAKFWNESGQCLLDVVDEDDARLRPNQIYAVGGLPLMLLAPDRARKVVDAVEKWLLTPLGLRSLSPNEKEYKPRYSGGPGERDSSYHQGTVWPYLLGSFIEAWVRVRGCSDDAKREARARFIEPILKHLNDAGLGHVSEIADADSPHLPRGCPFQAWSMAELLRVNQLLEVKPRPLGRHPTTETVQPRS